MARIHDTHKKAKAIMKGWQNFIDKREVTELKARERAEVCAKCEHAKKGTLNAFIKDKLKQVQGHYCYLCTCPLSAKIRQNIEPCPLAKWE